MGTPAITPIGQLVPSAKSPTSQGINANRAAVNFGLRTRPLGTITIEVTGGAADTDTFIINEGGVALYETAVEWTTSHAATAVLIAQAINANTLVNGWVATVSSATITIRQTASGAAGAITATLAANATVTIANSGNVSNDTDTWTEFVSGATFDGDLYYELDWSGALIGQDEARATELDTYCDGEAVTFWVGGLRANTGATALVQGLPLATATWFHTTYGRQLPFLDRSFPVIIKVAADEELLYWVGVI